MLNLSKREEEVLMYLAHNPDYDACAKALFISETTLKTHVSNIFKKANVKNLAQLIVKYYNELQFDFVNKMKKEIYSKRLQKSNNMVNY